MSISILMYLCFKRLTYMSYTCAVYGKAWSWGHLCSVWTDVVMRKGPLFVQCVWTDMVIRTGHSFVQCGDKHSHEDRALICAVCLDRHGHKDRTLICAVCGQTWSWGQDTYLCSVWTDMVTRTGHLSTCTQANRITPDLSSLNFASRCNAPTNFSLLERGVCTLCSTKIKQPEIF